MDKTTTKPLTRTTVIDAKPTEADDQVGMLRHSIDWHTIRDDVSQRIMTTLECNPTGCIFFNPAVTVSCPSPTSEFFRIVENEQAGWCRRASKVISRKVLRTASRWVSGGEWISHKYARYLDRALCFTGILFSDGQLILPHNWPNLANGSQAWDRKSDTAVSECTARKVACVDRY